MNETNVNHTLILGGDIIRIGFIGAGKVGFSLGKYFSENNLKVIGYYSRSIESAREAAIFTNSTYFKEKEELIKESDIIFITTPDKEIEGVWNSINKLSIKNKIICHCSGSLSSNVFSNIENYNSYGYSIHPMFAFSDKYNSHLKLRKAVFTIEGSDKYLKKIRTLFIGLGNKSKVISAMDKSSYHLASVVVSNHVIALIEEGIELLVYCGFKREEALESLYPLIINNIDNVKESGTVNSLTGPIERNDINTVKSHLLCLDKENRELYKLLSRKLLKIARVKNKNNDYSEIENMIGD